MIGTMLAKIRKDKGITKSEIAKLIGIDIGHLTHIEKGERKPSLKTLKQICRVLDIPYQPLLYTYDREITKDEIKHDIISSISYTKVLAINDINYIGDFIDCPSHKPSASIAIKITDDSMLNTFDLNTFAYIEFNSPIENNDIGLFQYQNQIVIRKFIIRQNSFILKADNTSYPDIRIENFDEFYIIGKVLR